MGTVLDYELNFLLKKYKCVKEVRGIGLMFVMEFHQDEKFPLEKIHRDLLTQVTSQELMFSRIY